MAPSYLFPKNEFNRGLHVARSEFRLIERIRGFTDFWTLQSVRRHQ